MAGPHLTAYVLSQELLALQAEDATAVETRQPPAVMMLEGAPRCRTPAPPCRARRHPHPTRLSTRTSYSGPNA
jgi:hypothetical protein